MQKKKGVSLIVLVITVIVMVILAGTIILTINNTGIMGKAQSAVDDTNLKEIQTLAELKWSEAFLDGNTTQESLEREVIARMQEEDIDLSKYVITVTDEGVEVAKQDALNPRGIIPEGGTYYRGWDYSANNYSDIDKTNQKVYNAGEAFPKTPEVGDTYIYGDYEYIYGVFYAEIISQYDTFGEGWHVAVINNNAEVLGNILESINGKPITHMMHTFSEIKAKSFVQEFKVPKTVTNVAYMFNGDTKVPSNFRIEEGVTSLSCMFGMTYISKAFELGFEIPKSVTSLNAMFYCCLFEDEFSFTIPSHITDISEMFRESSDFSGTITIDGNPTNYKSCFGSVDMSKITLAGKCSRELKQKIAETGLNADKVTIID